MNSRNHRTVLIACLLCLSSAGTAINAQDFSAIPLDALVNADAYVWNSKSSLRVQNLGKSIYRSKVTVTILNERGNHHAITNIWYDDFRSAKNIRGEVYDASGERIKKLKKDDILDTISNSGGSLSSDNRVKHIDLRQSKFPYTVTLSYELEYKESLFWPGWRPHESNAFTKQSSFTVTYPKEYALRHHIQGSLPEPIISDNKSGALEMVWLLSDIEPFEGEGYGPSWSDQIPTVRVAPSAFVIGGSSGNMSSWNKFGQWYYNLNANRQNFTAEDKANILEQIDGLSSKKEKIKKLYEFMQDNTRYVSVQLGIGGWQTFNADYVSENKYGDCKALTNYMHSLLKVAGIESHPALVHADNFPRKLLRSFPSNQFNHIILAIPDVEGDTLWLENTSQTSAFGHLGAFTENREVLLIKDKESKIVRTPASHSSESGQIRSGEIFLTANGNANAKLTTVYTGNQMGRVRSAFGGISERDKEEALSGFLDLSSYDLVDADFSETDLRNASISLPLDLELRRFGKKTGSRIFFKPNILEKPSGKLAELEEERKYDVRTSIYRYLDVDSLKYYLPEGYAVESIPEPLSLDTDFGSYHSSIEAVEDGSLLYVRRSERTQTYIAADRYEEFRVFVNKSSSADQGQVVLVKSKS